MRAKRNRQGAAGFDGLEFGGSEVAFGADPDAGGVRQSGMLLEKGLKATARMVTLALQSPHQAQFKFFVAGQVLLERERGLDSRQPGSAALFNGFDGYQLPLFGFVNSLLAIHLRDHALREQRHDPSNTEFRRLLDDRLDEFSFWQGLDQSNLAGQARDEAFFDNGQPNFVTIVILYLTEQFMARAIEHDDAFAATEPEDAQGVVGFTARQEEG